MNQELWKSVKRFLWNCLGMVLSAGLIFVQDNVGLLDLTNLSTETKGVVILVIGFVIQDLTKRINKAFSLEEKIGRALGVKK